MGSSWGEMATRPKWQEMVTRPRGKVSGGGQVSEGVALVPVNSDWPGSDRSSRLAERLRRRDGGRAFDRRLYGRRFIYEHLIGCVRMPGHVPEIFLSRLNVG